MYSFFFKFIKSFILRLPLYIFLFFLLLLVSYLTKNNNNNNIKDLSLLWLFIFFLAERLVYYLFIFSFNQVSDKQLEKFRSSTYHVKWLRLCRNLRRIFMGKAAIKPSLETSSLLLKLNRIPFKEKDKYSSELRKQHNKVIEELIAISLEIRKAENLDYLELMKSYKEKHSEYVDIYSKYLKHTKKNVT